MGHLERRNQIASRSMAIRNAVVLAAVLVAEIALFNEAGGIAQVRTE